MGGPDAPRDEYHCLVGPLLTRLQSQASEADIATYLRTEIVEHFGLSPEYYDFVALARRIAKWFEFWRSMSDPVTVFVAMLDEGMDVWRPVQARPLGDELFRIIGVDADVSDEAWEFPSGTIVRCKMREVGDGRSGMTAVKSARAPWLDD
jgi:hypothetical protein